MRLGSGEQNSKKPNLTQNVQYQSQNNQLKKLHEERLIRLQINRQSEMQDESKEDVFKKQIKNSSLQGLSRSYPQNLMLNSLLSDQRSIKQKPNSIALSSLFQEDPKTFARGISKNIKGVLMTCYGFVMDVLGQIAQSGVPFVLVNDSQQNGQGRVQRNFQGFKNMSLVIPPRTNKGYGVFHTKLWLIRFTTFLRIVICTGNQHTEDWIVWLNAYWYQDFPLKGMKISDYDQLFANQKQQPVVLKQQKKIMTKPAKNSSNMNVISLLDDQEEKQVPDLKQNKQKSIEPKKPFNFQQDFLNTLNVVLNKMFPNNFNLQKQIGVDLKKFDFTAVKVVLIPSIPGRHTLKDGTMKLYGMAKVKSIIQQIGPKIKKGTLTYNTSSLGVVDQNFLRQIYFSFLPSAESFSTSNYKVIYPSYKYITQQTCGEASVLFLKKQNYYKSQLKKQVFYHYEPSSNNCVIGAIPHLKTIIVQNLSPDSKQEKNKCIFFMGSHNMTKAAWGTYEKSDTQISFSNTQLGLLFIDMSKQQLHNWLPYKYPPKKYSDYDKPFLRY